MQTRTHKLLHTHTYTRTRTDTRAYIRIHTHHHYLHCHIVEIRLSLKPPLGGLRGWLENLLNTDTDQGPDRDIDTDRNNDGFLLIVLCLVDELLCE